MNERPDLTPQLNAETFRGYYYLKEELEEFCRKNGLQTRGSKIELTQRIAAFLETGEKTCATPKIRKNPARAEKNVFAEQINPGNIIEENFVCSEKHRAFFKEQIGKSFSFNVVFQKWLKSNSGKTYADAIAAYHQIMQEKKNSRTEIGSQFEYNTYIRDFFAANKDKTLDQAIKCWKFKKSQKGSHKYEKSDLTAIQKPEK